MIKNNTTRIKEIQKLVKSLNEEKKELQAEDRKNFITEFFGQELQVGDKIVKTTNLSESSTATKIYHVRELDYNCDNSIEVYCDDNLYDRTCFNKELMKYYKLELSK